MADFTYELTKKGKTICPSCGKKTLVPYVDAYGNILSEKVGKCDRADKCGYHYPPKSYFEDTKITPPPKPKICRKKEKPTYHSPEHLIRSTKRAIPNNLKSYLKSVFPRYSDRLDVIFRQYFVGNDTLWNGATIFWQIDRYTNIHAGKIMLYDATTGHRVKEPYNRINWYHTAYNIPNFVLEQCLFGEHLLANNNLPVFIVESEKTAIVLATLCSSAVFLACGGCGNLSGKLSKCLTDRIVTLIPDNGMYEAWKEKAKQLTTCQSVRISKVMELLPCNEGDDIADILLKFHSDPQIRKTLYILFYNFETIY